MKRSLYRRFAEYLATRGYHTVTWDWRGTGESRPVSLRGFPATMRDWGRQDLTGMIDWAGREFPSLPILVIGHSFGGQALGLMQGGERITAAATVSSQSGYWGWWPFPIRYWYAVLWHFLVPGLTRLVGWFPSRPLGLGEGLPRGVALEWSSWCRNPDYLGDWSGHQAFGAPLLSMGFTDDSYAPPRAVAELHNHYGSAEKTLRILSPRDAGLPRIGHFGFFRPEAQRLWDEVANWLDGKSR